MDGFLDLLLGGEMDDSRDVVFAQRPCDEVAVEHASVHEGNAR